MAHSGHARPDALRIYQKRTEVQRARGARKRRAWIEAAQDMDEPAAPTAQPSGGIDRQGANK